MSVIDFNTDSLVVSYNSEDIEIKKMLLDCIGIIPEEEEKLFWGIYNVPDELKKYNRMRFLSAEMYLDEEKTENLFLLLNRIFPGTYMFKACEWEECPDSFYDDSVYDEDEEDNWDCDEDEAEEGNWDSDEDEEENEEEDWDEDEGGLVNMKKNLILFDPDVMMEYQYGLWFSEFLDQGGGSNGADIDFDYTKKVVKTKIASRRPSEDFIEKIIRVSTEKGYQKLIDIIKEKID